MNSFRYGRLKLKNNNWVKLLFPLVFVFFSFYGFGQTKDLEAQYLYTKAEENYSANNSLKCLNLIKEAESKLGNTNAKILYLKLKAYDKISKDSCGLFPFNDTTEVTAQIKYFLDSLPLQSTPKEKYFEILDFKNNFEIFKKNNCISIAKDVTSQKVNRMANFEFTDVDNKVITKNDVKGKYILIFFCKEGYPEAIKNLGKCFDKFSNKSIVFFNFYMGEDRKKWLKYIKDNHFSEWINVSDLKFYDKEGQAVKVFKIESFPYYYFMSPNGNIISEDVGILEELSTILSNTLRQEKITTILLKSL